MENPIFQYFGSTSESSDEYYENLADSYLDEKDKLANVHSADTDDFLVKQILDNDFDEDEGKEMFVYKETNGEFDREEVEGSRSTKSTGLFSMITSGYTKAKSGIAKTVSQVGNMLKYSIIDKDSEQNWKEVINWLSGQFEHAQLSKLDFLMGFLLLASFYKNHPRHTHNYVNDLQFIEESDFYLKFAYGAYGWKALYSVRRGRKTHFRGMMTKAKTGVTKANTEALCIHTGLTPDDIIEVNWKSEQFNPGHYIALSHSTKDIIVAIRGTSHLSDVLSDLMGKYEEFQSGFVHSGILKCAQNKCKRFLPILDNLLQKFPDYSIKTVGHSLGGGVAALLTILLISEKPNWPLHCWAYASPCVVSKSISIKYNHCIYSFALDNDPISRISHGSAEALKNACVQLALQAENNWQRMFHVVKESVGIHDSVSKKLASFLKVKAPVDISKVDTTKSDVEKLVPTGRIFHVYENENGQYVMEESDHDLFTEIVISNRMINDHFPINYEARWRKVLENGELYIGKQELAEECL